ncbi:MAG TPA: MaoC family dehydratase N-terminal domain-containing protein [Methylomirabilota bacterium]|nr:MaoC family dehydratase N-terminal domain-containing protein [Methylomirabilota bacterium]
MPIQIDTSVKGKEYAPFTVTVERGKIKEFARAIGDLSPFYLDDAVGRASEWGDIIAPPTFAITFRDENADTNVVLRDLGVDIGRILHGEQEFEHYRPIRPGETYLCRTRISDIYEKSGRSGPMAFVVREMAVTDGENEIVCLVRSITVVRL